jgi:hypothetical protein
LNSKQYQQKILNDTKEIDVSHEYPNIPRNKNLSIRKVEPVVISNKTIEAKEKKFSFWSSKKHFEKFNKNNLSNPSNNLLITD